MKNLIFIVKFFLLSVCSFAQTSSGELQNLTSTATENESTDWLFVQGDKAIQVRYKLEMERGNIAYFRVQFRINFNDEVFCEDVNCLGYLMTFGYPELDNTNTVYSHYKFYNTYKRVYTMSKLMPLRMVFEDGSRRYLEKDGFYYSLPNNDLRYKADGLFYNCVDNILANDSRSRCTNGGWRDIFIESQAEVLK